VTAHPDQAPVTTDRAGNSRLEANLTVRFVLCRRGGGVSAGPDDHAHWHDFHDKFLSYGGPPLPLLRKELVGESDGLL
jgi:hypothetical protein